MAAARCFDLENEKEYMHGLLVNKLHDAIDEDKTKKIRQLLLSVLKKNLDAADMITMLNDLTYKGIIKVGEYSYLKRLLTDVGLQVLVDTVEKSEKEIQCLMDNNVVAEDEDTVQEESQENGERSKRKRTLDTSCERCAELQLKLELQKIERDTRANEFVLQIADRALTEDVLQNPRKRKRIFDDLLQFKAELVGPIRTGSILLTVRFYSLEDLTYFWSKYKDGTVTATLSDILLSDKILEVSREHHVEFYITCDISEDAYIEARRKLSSDDEVPGAMDAMARVSISDDTQGQEVIQEESLHEQVVSEAKERKAEATEADFAEETATCTPRSSEHMQDKPLRNVIRDIEQVEDLSGAMDLMEEMHVSMEGIETLDDALERLELHRKKMESGGRPNEGSQVFTHIKYINDEGRSHLQAIFSDVIDQTAFLDHEGVIVERLRAESLLKGQSATEELMMRRATLDSGECPILLLGEESSGKSSLLNVLLQHKVLPENHLPCTATFTRIKYAPPNEKRIAIRQVNASAQKEDEMETVIPLKDAGVSIHDALKPYLFPEDRSKQLAYTVDIFLPLDVLKNGVYIVDTPGIGQSKIIDRILSDFIDQNSVSAFIYVIRSDNAGGVQEDRLQKLLKMLVEHQGTEGTNSFDPRSAIFVCNRWDLVPKEDRKMVKEKIIKDLDKCWPGISPEKQLFTMAAKKARVSMELGYVSDEYEALLNGIKELEPISLQRQILLNYNWLRRFVTRVMTTAEMYVSNASLSKEDLLKIHLQVEQKLQTLLDNADSEMEELTQDLADNIEFTATCLKDHFCTSEVKQALTEWKLPDTQSGLLFEDFEWIIEETINKKLMSIISSWEKKGNYMATALEAQFKKFATYFQLLESKLKQIEDDLIEKTYAYPRGNLQDITDEFQIDVEGLKDDDVAKTPIVTLKEKVAIDLFAPVIMSVGCVSGIFSAIPMALFGLSSIKKWIRRKRQAEVVHLYRANPTGFLTKQANKICQAFLDLGLCKEYVKGRFDVAYHQLEIMKTHIPKLVEGTQKLLTCIQDDQRSRDKIIDTYRPLVETLGIGQGSTLYRLERFYLKFIDRKSYGVESFSTIQPTDSIVRSGIWSQVYPLHLKDSGAKVMIKAYLEVTEDDALDDIAALRFLGKPGEIYVPALMGSFNDPSTSLPSLVFSGTIMSLRKRCDRKIGLVSSIEDCKWRLFVSLIPLLQQLIDALEWLHQKGFVHMELSMDTVMVDQPPEKHGHIQLFNIGCPRPANIPSAGRLQPLGACRYLPLEVLQGGVYTHEGDIYGFGLIMWELWNGQQVYDDASDVTVEEFTNRLRTGEAVLSALSDVHGANAQGLETKWWAIIQKCTQRQPEERLNQNQIKRELEAYVSSILAKPTLKKGYEPV